jgi:hypothetical protein
MEKTSLLKSLALPILGFLCMSSTGPASAFHSETMERDYTSAEILHCLKTETKSWSVKNDAGNVGADLSFTYELFEMMHGYTPIAHPSRIHCLCYKFSVDLKTSVGYKYGFSNWWSGTSDTHLLDSKLQVTVSDRNRFSVKKCYPTLQEDENASHLDIYTNEYPSFQDHPSGIFELIEGTCSWKADFWMNHGQVIPQYANDSVNKNVNAFSQIDTSGTGYRMTQKFNYLSRGFGSGQKVRYYGILSFLPTAMPGKIDFYFKNNFLWGYYNDWMNKTFATDENTGSFSLPQLTAASW